MNFWISWVTPFSLASFELHSPWWISGYDSEGNAMICAAVRAASADEATKIIRQAYDDPPVTLMLRFITPQPDDWTPFCDRFPRADWMQWDATPLTAAG